MFTRLVFLLAAALPSWAYTSLTAGPGVQSAQLTVPAVPPFTAMGDYRMEFRLHDFTPTHPILSWGSTYGGPLFLHIGFTAEGEICARNGVDTLSRGSMQCANVTGHSDILVRVQRFAAWPTEIAYGRPGSFWLEVWDIDGTPIKSYCGNNNVGTNQPVGCPMTPAATPANWSTRAGYIGNPLFAAPFSLGWLKWHSTTVPPGSPPPSESTPADLADFRFEGNLNDESTGAYGVKIGAFKTEPGYTASPSHAPLCAAGKPQTYRAGYPAQLDGTASQALDGGAGLKYFWQQLSGPTELSWVSEREAARPWVEGTVFGGYVFQLTTTDSSGQSNSCTVKHGFVATDENDVVLTGNAATDLLLGPMIRFGANPWPWADDRHKAQADMQAANLDIYYPAWWEAPAAGTIAFTAGSATVAGAETSFTTDFCQGPEAPSVPKNKAQINIWYPNSSASGHGVRMQAVASCQSDTQLTLATPWGNDVADCPGGACQYALWGNDDVWSYNSAPANFYDAVAAFYALYYRTGNEEYLAAARTLADRHWVHQLDSGTVCAGKNGMGGCLYNQRWAPRNISLLGMILRAMDGRPDMWDGLHTIIAFYRDYYLAGPNAANIAWGLWDIREMAYHQAMVAYGALYSPDAAFRAACKAALSNVMDKLWNVTKSPDGSWQQLYYNYKSWPDMAATLTKGSTAVTANGTSWTAAMNGGRIVFMPLSTVKPGNRQAHEATYYTITYVDGTRLTLDRPYEGTSGTYGWMIGTNYATGWGVQPFIEGILGLSFEFIAEAIADTDPANAARAREHNVSIARWLRNSGYRDAVKGMHYFAGSVDCMPPIPESSTWCGTAQNASQARTLNAEALRPVMLAYRDTGDPELLAFADTLYNAMYGKPGTCPAGSGLCRPDGSYIGDFDDIWGYYMSGKPPAGQAHKWFGMFYGIGAGAAWPAYRAGGPRAEKRRSIRVGFHLASVPGAATVRVMATTPDGGSVRVPCSASPCTVEIDGRKGDHLFRLEYLSPEGKVLAATKVPAMHGQ